MSTTIYLLPVDESSHSENAIRWFANNIYQVGRQERSKICFAHIAEPPQNVSMYGLQASAIATVYKQQMEQIIERSNALEDKIRALCKELSVNCEKSFLKMCGNKPGEELVAIAKKHSISMIVMGSRGLGSVRRTILGSVSDYVVHHAHIPCVIIPAV